MSDQRVPIQSMTQMVKLMSEYYMGAKMAEGSGRKIAWVTSGAPVELLYASFSEPATTSTFPVRRSVDEMGLIGMWYGSVRHVPLV